MGTCRPLANLTARRAGNGLGRQRECVVENASQMGDGHRAETDSVRPAEARQMVRVRGAGTPPGIDEGVEIADRVSDRAAS
jgi:hypothetical protein